MDEALLLKELKAIIEESAKRGIKVFVMNRFDERSAQELYFKAEGSNNLLTIRRRLTELREFFESDEIDAIWYIRANRVLSAEEKATLLNKITKLLKPFTNSD